MRYILLLLLSLSAAQADVTNSNHYTSRTIRADALDGSLAPLNLIKNGGFERSRSGGGATAYGWTASTTGIFTVEDILNNGTTNIGRGYQTANIDFSSGAQTLVSDQVTIPAGLYGSPGVVSCLFKSSSTDSVFSAWDGTSNVSTNVTITGVTAFKRLAGYFTFPTSGTIGLKILSASNAAALYVDDCYIGESFPMARGLANGAAYASSGTITTEIALSASRGGTGNSSYSSGDLLYATASNVLSKLAVGSNGQVLTVSSGAPAWAASADASTQRAAITNYALAASVSSNALTVALKDAAGSDPSSGSPVKISFRDSTASTGTPVVRSVTGALSVVVSSGSTLGSVSGVAQPVYVYAVDNAGTVELAVAGSRIFEEGVVQSTTAEGGAGAADDHYTLYSTTARSNKAIRYLGRILATEATAGTWATAPSDITVHDSNHNLQYVSEIYVTGGTGHGSTNTRIRTFTTTTLSRGSDITYTSNSTNGDSFTINADGMYTADYADSNSGTSCQIGISINSTQLTTNVLGIAVADTWAALDAPTNLHEQVVGPPKYLRAGDVVRAHDSGNCNFSAANDVHFRITRIW